AAAQVNDANVATQVTSGSTTQRALKAAYGTRYAALRNESAWDRLLPTSDTANTLTTVQSVGSPQAGSEGRNAAPGSPFMTFTAGGAYVNDSNEGRWGATSAGTTTGYIPVRMQTDS